MTHNPHRLTCLAIFNGNNDIVLPRFSAKKVDGIVFFVGLRVVGGDEHIGAVVDANDGLAFIVAYVESVNIIATENDSLTVHGGALALIGFGETHHELFQINGAIARFGGAILNAFFTVALYHGYQGEAEYDGDDGIQNLHDT